jgi:hypothetical protein
MPTPAVKAATGTAAEIFGDTNLHHSYTATLNAMSEAIPHISGGPKNIVGTKTANKTKAVMILVFST